MGEVQSARASSTGVLSKGAIIGLVVGLVGGLLLASLVTSLLLWLLKKRRGQVLDMLFSSCVCGSMRLYFHVLSRHAGIHSTMCSVHCGIAWA